MRAPEESSLKRLRAITPPLLWMALLFVLSGIPGNPSADSGSPGWSNLLPPPSIQNLLHVPVYGVLAWLWCRTLVRLGPTPRRAAGWALVLTVAYAGLDEWHQSLVPGRFPSATDVLLDTIGAILAVTLFSQRWPRRVSQQIR